MTAPAVTTAPPAADALDWVGRELLTGAHARRGAAARELLHRTLWSAALAACAGRVRVEGAAAAGPAVYVANHSSHADTVAVRAAVGARTRRRLAVGAAEDYFFPTPRRARAITVAMGAFPFPRAGDLGLRRAALLLEAGWSVLLYPQGTRSTDATFRPGVLRLAEAGWPLVPVGIAGTDSILPKGARRPRRHHVAVVVGRPLESGEVVGRVDVVTAAVAAARRRAAELVAR